MIETGVIHGRFQLLHNDHLKYLLAGKERCRHLVVGITNPDPSLTGRDEADPGRSDQAANPFTYYERFCLVRAALSGAGIGLAQFTIVPFPINFPKLYRYYLPLDATFFLTIYDDWGEKKLAMFQALGLKTEVLWRRTPEQKGLTASEVRKRMAEGEKWQQMVPPAVAELLLQWHATERLRKLAQQRSVATRRRG
jgi:nicotinamide-nucleotide adenylyltransferase